MITQNALQGLEAELAKRRVAWEEHGSPEITSAQIAEAAAEIQSCKAQLRRSLRSRIGFGLEFIGLFLLRLSKVLGLEMVKVPLCGLLFGTLTVALSLVFLVIVSHSAKFIAIGGVLSFLIGFLAAAVALFRFSNAELKIATSEILKAVNERARINQLDTARLRRWTLPTIGVEVSWRHRKIVSGSHSAP